AGEGQVRVHGHVRRAHGRDAAADVRADHPQRAHRLRPQRHLASRVDVAAEGLPAAGQLTLGRIESAPGTDPGRGTGPADSPEAAVMAKSNRRAFLAKGPAAVAVAATAATAVTAPVAPTAAAAAAGQAAGEKPVKKVLWNNGKRPEKQALFSPAVSY